MSHTPIIDQMVRETQRVLEIRRKRYVVFFDHLKTICFGFIGAACINPVVNQVSFNTLAYHQRLWRHSRRNDNLAQQDEVIPIWNWASSS